MDNTNFIDYIFIGFIDGSYKHKILRFVFSFRYEFQWYFWCHVNNQLFHLLFTTENDDSYNQLENKDEF